MGFLGFGNEPLSIRCAKGKDSPTLKCEGYQRGKDGDRITGVVEFLANPDGTAEVVAEDCENKETCDMLKGHGFSNMKAKRIAGER